MVVPNLALLAAVATLFLSPLVTTLASAATIRPAATMKPCEVEHANSSPHHGNQNIAGGRHRKQENGGLSFNVSRKPNSSSSKMTTAKSTAKTSSRHSPSKSTASTEQETSSVSATTTSTSSANFTNGSSTADSTVSSVKVLVPAGSSTGSAASSTSRPDTGSSGGNIRQDFDTRNGWTILLDVGNPAQQIQVLIDTGSNDFVMLGRNIDPGTIDAGSAFVYDANSSTTASVLHGYTFTESLGSNAFTGTCVLDTVTFGGDTTFDKMIIMAADSQAGHGNNGILGLSYFATQGSSPSQLPSFLWQIRNSISDGVFTVAFNGTDNTGTVDFGFIDDSKYEGDLVYANVTSDTSWIVPISGIGTSNSATGAQTARLSVTWETFFDTGTNIFTYLPRPVLDVFFAEVEGAFWSDDIEGWGASYAYPCGATVPDMIWYVGEGQTPVRIASEWFAFSGYINDTTTLCYTRLFEDGSASPISSEIIIQALFMVFDYDHGRIGFGNKSDTNTGTGKVPTVTRTKTKTAGGSQISVCTGDNHSGNCHGVNVTQNVCQSFDSVLMLQQGSVSLASDLGLRCSFFTDDTCNSPFGALKDLTSSTGVSSMSSVASLSSVLCVDETVESTDIGDTKVFMDGKIWEIVCAGPSACWIIGTFPWQCYSLQWNSASINLTQFTLWTSTAGKCWFYGDPGCTDLVSGDDPLVEDSTTDATSASFPGDPLIAAVVCI